jgi:hypothetical protein
MLGNTESLGFSYNGITDIRNVKGYMWEHKCNNLIKQIPNISVTHNSTSFTEWKSTNKDSKHDAIITINKNIVLSLEYKYRDVPSVYHSWFMQCWYNKTSDIFIVNNPQCLTYEDRRTLESHGQKVMSLAEAVVYLGSLVYARKYITTFNKKMLYSNRFNRFSKIYSNSIWFLDKKNRLKTDNKTNKLSETLNFIKHNVFITTLTCKMKELAWANVGFNKSEIVLKMKKKFKLSA